MCPSIHSGVENRRKDGRQRPELVAVLSRRNVRDTPPKDRLRWGPGQEMLGEEGVGGSVLKVTSTTGLCTQLPGSSHAWDVSERLGLHTGSGNGEPEDNSAGAGGGEDSEDTEAALLQNPGTRWLPPSGKSGRADRDARTPRTSWQTVPTREHAPNTALPAQRPPMRTGRIVRSAPTVAHSPAPATLGASAGAGADPRGGPNEGVGPLRPGRLLCLLTLQAGSQARHASHQLRCLLLSTPGLTWAPNGPQLPLLHWEGTPGSGPRRPASQAQDRVSLGLGEEEF